MHIDPELFGSVVTIITVLSSGGVMALIVKWGLDKLDHKPSKLDTQHMSRLDRLEASREITDNALKALLFDKLARLHEETIEQGLPVSTDMKVRVETTYQAYKALGGNGVGKHYYDELIEANAREHAHVVS